MKICAAILLLFLSNSFLPAQETVDWPRWRGADHSGSWYGGPEIDRLSSESVEELWRTEVGSGYCGPTVSKGKVYLTDLKDGHERVLCFDAVSGKKLWTYAYPVTYAVGYPTGPRASVLVHEGMAYSLGTMGHLHCLDAIGGKLIWKVNGVEEYGSRLPIWGMASNPIIVDELLIVMMGGIGGASMVAFHKDSGKEEWRALGDEASYVAPVLIRQAGQDVLVCWTGGSFAGLDPANGKTHWRIPFRPRRMIMNVADPVYDPPYLFLSAFFDGSYLLELDQEKLSARLVWERSGISERETDALHCCISTPIIRDGYVYGIDSYGELRCLELASGDRIWESQELVPRARWANVHLVQQEDRVWGFNEIGDLSLGKLTPDGYESLGSVRLIDPVPMSPNPRNGVNWAHPAFSGKLVYVRSDGALVCLRIR